MNISNTDNIIDIVDVIERIKELRDEQEDYVEGAPDGSETPKPDDWAEDNPADAHELDTLVELLDNLKGEGGDHQHRGDWYPSPLIADRHFKAFAQEVADDLGLLGGAEWPLTCMTGTRQRKNCNTTTRASTSTAKPTTTGDKNESTHHRSTVRHPAGRRLAEP